MSLFIGPNGKILVAANGKIAADKACCCIACSECCLPTGPGCAALCPGDAGMPDLFMDVTITGDGFGNISFVNVPITSASATGAGFCIGLFAKRQDGATTVGADGPFDIGDTTWDCAASKALLAAAGCSTSGGDCDWSFSFAVKCQRNDAGKLTGKYLISWLYLYDDTFEYSYTSAYLADPTIIAKCWPKDGAVDMTWVQTKPMTDTFCPFIGPSADKTITVRIHT